LFLGGRGLAASTMRWLQAEMRTAELVGRSIPQAPSHGLRIGFLRIFEEDVAAGRRYRARKRARRRWAPEDLPVISEDVAGAEKLYLRALATRTRSREKRQAGTFVRDSELFLAQGAKRRSRRLRS